MQTRKIQQGFTLIELMIVVAIIGILAAIAIPAYQDYVIRAQISDGLSLAAGSKTALAEYYQNNGDFPTDQGDAGLAEPEEIVGRFTSSVDGTDTAGVITITYGREANSVIDGETVLLSAITHPGSIEWTCKSNTLEGKYLPSSCRR